MVRTVPTTVERTPAEIQRAHDLLECLLLHEFEQRQLPLTQVAEAEAFLAVFCWLLGHPRKTVFADVLGRIEDWVARSGGFYNPETREFILREKVETQ